MMPTSTWGAGGVTKSTHTGYVGDGWRTPNLPFPTARRIYDGSRPIHVTRVVGDAGTGDRAFRFAYGPSGWLPSGSFANSGGVFAFRVTQESGDIKLGLLHSGKYTTYWVSGAEQAVNWSPNGEQPGHMDWEQAPAAPGLAATPGTDGTSIKIDLTLPSDNGGATVTSYTVQASTVSNFASIAKEITTASDTTMTGLSPGKTYYVRAMAKNAVTNGAGKKGGVASVTRSVFLGAKPSTAATFLVVPGAAGRTANLFITPPASSPSANGYKIVHQPVTSSNAANGLAVTTETTDSTPTISGLKPGQRYSWRVTAKNAVGEAPVSSTQYVTQPNPSTNPGDYFDGSTPSTDDEDYRWSSTADASTSIAVGHVPTGWEPFYSWTGATGVVHRVTANFGTRTGTMGTRVTFFSDSTQPGFIAGTQRAAPGWAVVASGVQYNGSIYMTLLRQNRVAAIISWMDETGVLISQTVGSARLVRANTLTRLSTWGTSPAGAAYAAVGIIDVAGDGHTNYRGGDVITMDGAMLSLGTKLLTYFDGSTPDTSQYDYRFAGATHASESYRLTKDVNEVDPLADPLCDPVPQPPRPPSIIDECIDELGVWRRYWIPIPKTEVSDWLAVLPTLVLTTKPLVSLRQLRIRYYPNPFEFDALDVEPTAYCAEQIITYVPRDTVLTIDGPLQRVFAEVAGGEGLAADHLLYGTGGTPATWPVLSCGIQYMISLDMDLDVTIDDFDTNIYLTRRS